ncbi:C3a anaphylatoxin chemotactic receptor-like [Argonauta hians]
MILLHPNDTHIYTLEELNAKKARFAVPSTITMSFLMVFGIIGNSLVLYVYSRKFKSTSTNSFILALSTFDLLNCLIGMPTEIADDQLPLMFNWELGCKVLRFTSFFSTGASCLTLVIIAMDRYQRVCLGKEQIRSGWAKMMIVLTATMSAIIVSPIIELAGIDTESTDVPYINGTDCAIRDKYKNSKWPLIYFMYLAVIIIVCLIILIATYTMIGLTVKSRLGRQSLNGRTVVRTMADLNREKDRKVKTEKTTKTFFMVTVLFIFSFLPCLVIQISRALTGFKPHSPMMEIIFNLGLRSYFLGNSLNPFIYGYCNSKFREGIFLVLGRMQEKFMDEPRTKAHVYSLSAGQVHKPASMSVTDSVYE